MRDYISTFRPGVHSEVKRQKGGHDDFKLPEARNKNEYEN
jgi:hypothetical protein